MLAKYEFFSAVKIVAGYCYIVYVLFSLICCLSIYTLCQGKRGPLAWTCSLITKQSTFLRMGLASSYELQQDRLFSGLFEVMLPNIFTLLSVVSADPACLRAVHRNFATDITSLAKKIRSCATENSCHRYIGTQQC